MSAHGFRRFLIVIMSTALVIVLASCCALALLSWRPGDLSSLFDRRLPFSFLPTPIPTAATLIPALPTATPTPLPPSALILTDPTLRDLLVGLTDVHSGQAIQISMSQEALDNEIRDFLASNPSPGYQYHSLMLEPGRLTIAGQAQIERIVANLEVTGRPVVEDCWFDVKVEEVRIGSFAAPAFIAQEIENSLHLWAESYRANATVCIQELELSSGQILFVGVVK